MDTTQEYFGMKYEIVEGDWINHMGSKPIRLVRSKDNSDDYGVNRRHIFELENGLYSCVWEFGSRHHHPANAEINNHLTLDSANKEFEIASSVLYSHDWSGGLV